MSKRVGKGIAASAAALALAAFPAGQPRPAGTATPISRTRRGARAAKAPL